VLLDDRIRLAGKLRARSARVADEVVAGIAGREADPTTRSSEPGRHLTVEDAGLHIDSLAGAIEAGAPAAFQEYMRWVARMLASRGIAPALLAASLLHIQNALNRDLSESERQLIEKYISAGRDAALERAPEDLAGEPPEVPVAAARRKFVEAILEGERRKAAEIAFQVYREGYPIQSVYLEVFQAALYEVGEMWESNWITVAEEHMATSVVQSILPIFYRLLPPAEIARGRAVLTGVQHELHGIGAHMVADMLESDGWDVRFLGADTPPEGVLKVVERHQAAVLGISCTTLMNIPYVVHLSDAVRRHFGESRPHIVVGGGTFRANPGMWREIGADGFAADFTAAVSLMRETRWQSRGQA
jgi:methanogenic corrinoid protein MtbC1